jgi:hypothetical protein
MHAVSAYETGVFFSFSGVYAIGLFFKRAWITRENNVLWNKVLK